MMHWLDLSILVIIALSMLTGFVRGFIKETIALGIWIIAIWVAFHYFDLLLPWLSPYISDKSAQTVSAFILLLLAILLMGGLANILIAFLLKRSGLSAVDRFLGLGFGLARGIFVVSLAIVLLNVSSLPHQRYAKDSFLYERFTPIVAWLGQMKEPLLKKAKLYSFASSEVSYFNEPLTFSEN